MSAKNRIRDILHLEGKFHLVFDVGQVHTHETIYKCLLVDSALLRALECGEEAVVDDSGQVCVLEEGHVVDELLFVISLFWSVSPHGDIVEDVCEVGPHDVVEELLVLLFVKLFDQEEVSGPSLVLRLLTECVRPMFSHIVYLFTTHRPNHTLRLRLHRRTKPTIRRPDLSDLGPVDGLGPRW
jgi:hypothetical protein